MTETSHEAYPLSWPAGWPRAREQTAARFSDDWTLYRARQMLEAELRRFGGTDVVLSSNIPLRLDGLPYSNSREPADHGVAVYFKVIGKPRVLACDCWNRVVHNIIAIVRTVEAMRGQVRWGVGSVDQAFAGYKALPPAPEPGAAPAWWIVLGVSRHASRPEIMAKRRELLQKHHPDMAGGSASLAAAINAAADEGLDILAGVAEAT